MICSPVSAWDGHKDRSGLHSPSNMKSKSTSSRARAGQTPVSYTKVSPRHHKRPRLQANAMAENSYVANISAYHNLASSSQPSRQTMAALEKQSHQELVQACWAMSTAILGPLEPNTPTTTPASELPLAPTPTSPSRLLTKSTCAIAEVGTTASAAISHHSELSSKLVEQPIKQEPIEARVASPPTSSSSPSPKSYVFQFTSSGRLEEPVASALRYYFEHYYTSSKPICIPEGWLCAFDRDLFMRWPEEAKSSFSQGGESFLGSAEDILSHTRTALEAQIQARERLEEAMTGRRLQLVASDMLLKAGECWDRVSWFSKDTTLSL